MMDLQGLNSLGAGSEAGEVGLRVGAKIVCCFEY